MLRTIFFCVAALSTFTTAVWAELNCTAVPISLAVANSTLSSGVKRRGVAVTLGTPPQKFSLTVAATYNNTYFQEGPVTKENCPMDADTPAARCITLKGGVFDRDASFTWLPQTKQSFRGSSQDFNTVLDTFDRGQEVLSTSEFNLTNYPVGLLSKYTGDAAAHGMLGLSLNSTLLETLVAEGKISSNSWALDYGWSGYDSTWVDGALTLGGYDKSRFQGDLYPQDFSIQSNGQVDQECALKVTIESMVMTNSSGSVDLLPGGKSEAKLACVTPNYPLITLPGTMFDIFNQNMNGKYSDDKRSVGAFYLWGFVDSGTPYALCFQFI
ncbi:aspartic peptidase domain-containing protein [Sphaerosporella brunnea]|uniref:Aspartic peptidase domain-containing protein n=1 Tax=Sphaerosporella brunnea TaxID=1250544 RepID=A0A5J5FAZ9_9PEZI|nr:aspartic peptidase domain-containing protein [Sphaerosporella brunnea]